MVLTGEEQTKVKVIYHVKKEKQWVFSQGTRVIREKRSRFYDIF